MKIAQVIHGFPPFYMAGSEVYTYNLCCKLAKRHDVHVFSRIEDPYEPLYNVRKEIFDGIDVTRVNKPPRDYTFRSKYIDRRIDEVFEEWIESVDPDIAHVGHLSHLSTNIVKILKERRLPIVYTLHDFWLVCLRGQLLTSDLKVCEGPNTEGCARCFSLYFRSLEDGMKEIEKWKDHMTEIRESIDFYLAPSKFLRGIFVQSGIPEDKIAYSDYGFDTELFAGLSKTLSEVTRFGFLGRIIPAKGIHLLIEAFNDIDEENAELSIYGDLPSSAKYLRNRIRNPRIHLKGPYDNRDVAKVLSEIDILVVPSIWYENSPLVIHEAFLSEIPVIATNLGGMAEYIKHGVNGLLFRLNDVSDLETKMEMFLHNPAMINNLGKNKSRVVSIQEDAERILNIYKQLLGESCV